MASTASSHLNTQATRHNELHATACSMRSYPLPQGFVEWRHSSDLAKDTLKRRYKSGRVSAHSQVFLYCLPSVTPIPPLSLKLPAARDAIGALRPTARRRFIQHFLLISHHSQARDLDVYHCPANLLHTRCALHRTLLLHAGVRSHLDGRSQAAMEQSTAERETALVGPPRRWVVYIPIRLSGSL